MTFRATIPSTLVLTWQSQVVQYPALGPEGISYFAGVTPLGTVDCLLYRNEGGAVVGILNHYGFDSVWEKTGNVNVFVRRNCQRQGIATALIMEADRRWPINLDQQHFTPEGAAFAERLRADGVL